MKVNTMTRMKPVNKWLTLLLLYDFMSSAILHVHCNGENANVKELLMEMEDLANKMIDLKLSVRGIPVLLNLVKERNSPLSLCEEVAKLEEMSNFLQIMSSDRAELWLKNSNLQTLALGLGRWRQVFFLCNFPVDQTYGEDRFSVLHFASALDDLETVQMLIQREAAVDYKDKSGNSPIHFAAFFNSTKALKFLLHNGAPVNDRNSKGYLPVHVAALGRAAQSLEILENNGANLNAKDDNNSTALDYAKDVKVAEFLIDRGGDLNQRGPRGNTRLHSAIFSSKPIDFIELLIKKGANVNAKNDDGKTPLQLIWDLSRNYDRIKLLIDHGAQVHGWNNRNGTMLHAVVKLPDAIPVMKLLLEKGLDINVKDDDGNTPLHVGTERLNDENCKFLLENGADINTRNNNGKTPLHVAAKIHEFRIPPDNSLKLLLSKNATVNAQDNKGRTPLHEVSETYCLYCARILIANGADPLLKDHEGKTAYQLLLETDIDSKKDLVNFLKNYSR